MTRTPPTRGGAREGAGRPRADGSTGELVRVSVKIEASQRAAFEALGGSAWLRQAIEQATKTNRP